MSSQGKEDRNRVSILKEVQTTTSGGTANESLRPCPFCGSLAEGRMWIGCSNDGCGLNGHRLKTLEEWQDAACWKELSQAKKEAEEWKREAMRQYPTPEAYDAACLALHKEHERSKEWKQWAEKLVEEFKKLIDFTGRCHDAKVMCNAVTSRSALS